MPPDQRADLMSIARRMAELVMARQWSAMPALEAEISSLLDARNGEWSEAEREALRYVRSAWQLAQKAVNEQSRNIEQWLHDMENMHEGWLAYGSVAGNFEEYDT